MDILIAVALGSAAGLLSGVLGIGGGTITIPVMVLVLSLEQHTAQGISLAAMLVTALVGSYTQRRQGNVKLRTVFLIAPSAIAFSYLGAWAAGIVAAEWLTRIFAVALLLIGIRMLFSARGGKVVGTD
jgi:uncharacterized membrane protein YfcA